MASVEAKVNAVLERRLPNVDDIAKRAQTEGIPDWAVDLMARVVRQETILVDLAKEIDRLAAGTGGS